MNGKLAWIGVFIGMDLNSRYQFKHKIRDSEIRRNFPYLMGYSSVRYLTILSPSPHNLDLPRPFKSSSKKHMSYPAFFSLIHIHFSLLNSAYSLRVGLLAAEIISKDSHLLEPPCSLSFFHKGSRHVYYYIICGKDFESLKVTYKYKLIQANWDKGGIAC